MSLPVPKLDDREFRDLVSEAVVRIRQRCPQWTDFNASDPGMTLVDVMAWMTDIILYRLNRVPERNYVKFLELMGVRLKPVEAARAWVQFTVGGAVERIPRGTVVSTKKERGNEAVPFETRDDLFPTTAHLTTVLSVAGERTQDHSVGLDGVWRIPPASGEKVVQKTFGERILSGLEPAPHTLYLRDSRLGFGDPTLLPRLELRIRVDLQTGLDGAADVEWDVWDGTGWAPIVAKSDTTHGLRTSGEVVFDTLATACRERDSKEYAFRARLVGHEPDALPTLLGVRRRVAVNPSHHLPPEKVYLASERRLPKDVAEKLEQDVPQVAYTELDLTHDPFLFGTHPSVGDVLYVRSVAFGRPKATVRIDVQMSPRFRGANASRLELLWEYYATTGRWTRLGRTTPERVTERDYEFTDGTNAFTKSGAITFVVPDGTSPFALQGEMGRYVRATIVDGSYGDVEDRVPRVAGMSISFEDVLDNWERVVRENYLDREDITAPLASATPTAPFIFDPDRDPALYLGFDAALPNRLQGCIYFALLDEVGALYRRPDDPDPDSRSPIKRRRRSSPSDEPTAAIRWEYSRDDRWEPLARLSDGTHAFTRSNAVTFVAPANWTKAVHRDTTAFWLRARLETGELAKPPYVRGIYLNAVEAEQVRTIRDEILGSSTAEAFQTFRLNTVPILPHPHVVVREKDSYAPDELARLQAAVGPNRVVADPPKEVIENGEKRTKTVAWVRWHEVDSFFASDEEARDFVVDHTLGTVTFGDGRKGKIPPRGTNNVKAESYRQSLGAKGNVGRNTIVVLETNVEGVEKVANVDAAEGGADPETIEAAKERGPRTIHHRDRAVTIGDFEALACAASSQVARARAVQEGDEIAVVIVPESEDPKPRPGSRLIDRVLSDLDSRRLVTTRVKVVPPEYEDIRLSLEVSVKRQFINDFLDIAKRIEERLRDFVHPLEGGDEGNGWDMGRALHVSELYYTIEQIPEVDVVDSLRMWRWNDVGPSKPEEQLPPDEQLYGPPVDRIALGPRGFPFFRGIQIVQG